MHRAQLHFQVFGTTLGWMAVAWSESGLCRVVLPQASIQLARRRLEEELGAGVEPGAAHPGLEAAVTRWETGDDSGWLNLPLDPAVWGQPGWRRRALEVIGCIERGRVLSYADVARATGNPRAARAVGGVCASNPVPLVVPCHRVIASSGEVGGFMGGLQARALKTALLDREGVPVVGGRISPRIRGGSWA